MTRGFWLTPNGEFLDLGTKKHIDMIIDGADKFGEKLVDIKNDYNAHNEGWRFEGKAREQIMLRVMKRNFIRIRENYNFWTVQLWQQTNEKNIILSLWAKQISKITNDKFAEIRILDLSQPIQKWHISTIDKWIAIANTLKPANIKHYTNKICYSTEELSKYNGEAI